MSLIDALNANHRSRLSSAMQYWYNEMDKYRQARRETILHHSGSPVVAQSLGVVTDKRMMANLMQLSAQAHAITLAWGDPKYKAVAQRPSALPIAKPLEAFLNRWSELICLGDKARMVAMDSFFGFGIFKTAIGLLPPEVQTITGQQAGPMVQRISQDNFFYDGQADTWDAMTWQADLCLVPLDEAKRYQDFLDFNPQGANDLSEYTAQSVNKDGKIHQGGYSTESAVPMTRIVNVYFPGSAEIATWPANDIEFSGVVGDPLLVRKWNGHPKGPYAVLTHLDIPDNIIPVAESESTKRLHVLFNELADRTSHQAVSAKMQPIFETGSERDMQRLEDADDRAPVGVQSIDKIGQWSKPGPDQSQTAYMAATLQLFKEFSGNLDDTLGLGSTAGTAAQSQLIRQATNARGAEKRRRMDRVMVLVAKQLTHLILNDQAITLPNMGTLEGTDLPLDLTWHPPGVMPRNPDAEDYKIDLIPYTLERRDPAVRLEQLNEATQQILLAFQAAQQGAGIDMEAFIKLQADYRDLPELESIWSGMLPSYNQEKGAGAEIHAQRPGVGHYVRENVSQQTNGGSLFANLQNGTGAGGANNQPGGGQQINL
jgi:hypothetical protein